MQNVLEVSHLEKQYRNFALRDVSFHVSAGTITGFIGPNGAGKTTTMRVLLGLSQYSSGCVSFFGENADASHARVRARIGVVLDGDGFFDELTALQMARVVAGGYPAWDRARFSQNMEMFSLDPAQKIRTFSRGMRAKFALALALSHSADLLVMDEPTSGLDPLIRRELLDTLKKYLEEEPDRAVLFSTHITSDLDRVADELVLINNGRIVFQKDKDTLLDTYRIVRGRKAQLTAAVRPLVHDLRETQVGFTGITHDAVALAQAVPGIITERASIEDIMAAACAEDAPAEFSAEGGNDRARAFV